MNSADRDHDTERAPFRTSILPASMSSSGHKQQALSNRQSIGLSKALQQSYEKDSRQRVQYEPLELSNDDIQINQHNNLGVNLNYDSVGQLHLSSELDAL